MKLNREAYWYMGQIIIMISSNGQCYSPEKSYLDLAI